MSHWLRREGVYTRGAEDRVKLEDEVSSYWWSAALAEEARQGVKGREGDHAEGVRTSRCRGGRGLVNSAVGIGKGEC